MTDQKGQLVLDDETLRVIGCVLPAGGVAREIAAAREIDGIGYLRATDARAVLDALVRAQSDAWCIVAPDALAGAIEHYRLAMSRAGVVVERVTVHVWDVERDGPAPSSIVAGRLPTLPAGATWL